ncbi:hypothetical protein DXN05_14960 [Deminuibacter soli]|uniref:Uncharacterized protein n=1 Tax=Deminuibacter soli TaxID=2291815 RepID=A0A3E1NH87_9BACT|nr:hypothetical protein DXN05_14960 [Deminuibacter soli]
MTGALLLCLFCATAQAQTVVRRPAAGAAGSWRLLGTVSARHTADHDAILVQGPYDHFRRIKFKVTDSPLTMYKLVVTYDDRAAPEVIATRFDIPKGGESRVIDLRGGSRKLRSIEFWYETKGFLNGKADVTVFGMK